MAADGDVFVSYSREDKDRVLELAAQLRASGVSIWIDQGGIDGDEVLAGIRAAVAPEARIGGRRRRDRQQVQDAAAERIDDVRELGCQIPQRP